MNKRHKFFTIMVVGDNPDELMSKYAIDLTVPKYIKYHYLDAEKMKANAIKVLDEIVNNPKSFNLTGFQLDMMKEKLLQTKNMSTFDYYASITRGLEYDDNGDAWCDRNPNGKWKSYKLGENLSLPLIKFDSSEVHQARKGEIDWERIHMPNTALYETVWDLIKGGKEAVTDTEKQIVANMSDKDNYFARFSSKEEYVIHNCAYWNYAFLNENGWLDMDDTGVIPHDWISNYFNRFVEGLSDDSLITIYECALNQETEDDDIF